jgi:acyl carrier protein
MAQIFGVAPNDINDESSHENIEQWDSLKHMQLIMALEDEFEIEFADRDIPEMISFNRIVYVLSEAGMSEEP